MCTVVYALRIPRIYEKTQQKQKQTCKIENFYTIRVFDFGFSQKFGILNSKYHCMAKGKATYQAGKAAGGGRRDYVYAVNKKNLPAGEKLKLMKYDKVTRTHVEYTFTDVK